MLECCTGNIIISNTFEEDNVLTNISNKYSKMYVFGDESIFKLLYVFILNSQKVNDEFDLIEC